MKKAIHQRVKDGVTDEPEHIMQTLGITEKGLNRDQVSEFRSHYGNNSQTNNWKNIWMSVFGTTEWLGLNMGFWVSMAVVLLIVIIMNLVFWRMKPIRKED